MGSDNPGERLDRLERVVTILAEDQVSLQKQMYRGFQEVEQQFKRTDERIDRLAAVVGRTSDAVNRTLDLMDRVIEAQKEAQKENQARFAENEARYAEDRRRRDEEIRLINQRMSEMGKETDARIQNLVSAIGELIRAYPAPFRQTA